MAARGTVIIVTYNADEFIGACLDSLDPEAAAGKIKVVVVDNCSSDGTRELVRNKYGWVVLIESDYNGGFGAGNNLGLKEAEGEWVFFLNPDAVATAGCIEELADYLTLHPNAGCIAPAIRDGEGRRIVSYFPFTTLRTSFWWATGLNHVFPVNRTDGSWEIRRQPPDRTVEVDRVLGAAMMLPCRALQEVGGFDERFFLFSEEEDLCFRLMENGWKIIYHPEVVVQHAGSGIMKSIKPLAIAAANWSRYLYLRKNVGRFSAEISRWMWIKMIFFRYLVSLFKRRNRIIQDYRQGYLYSIKSLLKPGYFDRILRPPTGRAE